MRIAFLTHQFPGARMGGLGSYTVNAARALASAGHDVTIFTFPIPEEARQQFSADATDHLKLQIVPDLATRVADGTVRAEQAAAVQSGGEAVYRLAMGTLLAQAVLAEHAVKPFDVVEAPEYEALNVPLMLSLRRAEGNEKRLAVVTQLHSGSAVGRRGNSLSETPADAAIDALEAASILLADGVVAMTNAVVRETRRALGIEREVDLVPLAVPLETEFVPPPADGAVLFVGRLERLKGADVLVRAASIFLAKCPTARVRFVGPDTPTAPVQADGEEKSMRAWMMKQVPAALQSRVEFTGELPQREVTMQMRGSRFLVLPSVVENFSLVASQALGMGRTSIYSSGIGTAEIYGETGVDFPNGDADALAGAMEILWNDPGRIEMLSLTAWKRAAGEFNRDKVLAQQIAFYERTIAKAALTRNDLSGLPPRLASALMEPLVSMTRFACGIQEGPATRTPGQRLLAIMDRIAQQSKQLARIFLYGAGRHSARLLTEKGLWATRGHEVVGFIDDGPQWATGSTYLGLPVVNRAVLLERIKAKKAIEPIVLSTDTFEHQFWEQTRELREAGVRVFKLYGS